MKKIALLLVITFATATLTSCKSSQQSCSQASNIDIENSAVEKAV